MKSGYIFWQGKKKRLCPGIYSTRETFLLLLGATSQRTSLAEKIVTKNALFEQKKVARSSKGQLMGK